VTLAPASRGEPRAAVDVPWLSREADLATLPDSDWDLLAVLPDAAPDRHLDLAAVWSDLRELRRMRVEVIPIRRRDFEEDRHTLGELAEAVAREGHIVYGR